MITKALRPRLFEIPDFLTEDECEHIIAMAESSGMQASGLHMDEISRKSQNQVHGRSKAESNVFYKWDKNKDGVITAEDVKKFAVDTRYLYLEDQDIVEMFKELNITEIDDGKITEEEFETLNTDSLNEYLKNLRENHPRFRDRFSEQTWLQQGRVADPIMRKIKSRVQRLTKLSKRIIDGSEQLQVVHYNVNGHYHAHFDGQSKKQFGHLECCHFVADGKTECRLCRYITILYYLNDVEEGGETAFPVADSENYTHSDFQMRKDGDFFNLSKFCHNATSLVAPKRGKAVMWYNHHVDEHGWLGERDDHSLHGGCDIIKGEKWVANNWITAPEVDSYHRTSLYALADHILAGLEV
ncbi:transmembrane prolyl 4-hydroxylase-like isoform X2 [Rhopilema esculentum]